MIELEVSNFQSVRHATMVVSGFTAIVGRSNIGKSALVRAAQCALTGATGTGFVRHGAECDRRVRGTKKCKCFSRVTIRSPKIEVTWEKGDNVNRYVVKRPEATEPEIYEGLERGTPEFLLPGYQMVKVGERRELIQIPDQFSPIFLLNQSGLTVADVLSDVARLDSINKAMGLANKDRKDDVSRRKIREEDAASLRVALSQYDGLDDLPVKALTDTLEDLTKKQKLLLKIDDLMARLSLVEKAIEALDLALRPELPDSDRLDERSAKLYQVQGFMDSLLQKAPVLRKLTGVDQVEIPEDGLMHKSHADLVRADDLLRRLETAEIAVQQWTPVESLEVPEIESLDATYTETTRIGRFISRFDGVTSDLQRYSPVENTVDLNWDPVEQKYNELNKVWTIMNRARTVAEVVSNTSKELKLVESEEGSAQAELEALGVCPACDQKIGENHRLHLEGM